MKRTKLAATSSLPGTMLPSSTWYKVPRCFACDDPIRSHRFSTSLLQGHTQYTHSSIPVKLGEYIGDDFVVIVTSEDALCRNCMNLLNTMDRLEEELKEHRARLVTNLRRKYGLDSSTNQTGAKSNMEQSKVDMEDSDSIEILSDEEWVPYNKKRKTLPVNSNRSKVHRCGLCKMEFSDVSRLTAHLSMHRDQKDRLLSLNEVGSEGVTPKIFKCGCCTLSFSKKEALAVHMRSHTVDKQQLRPSTEINLNCQPTAQTIVDMKLVIDAESKTVFSTDRQRTGLIPVKGASPTATELHTPMPKNQNDSGGKVCLLALWNNGSCTDHPECQKSSNAPVSHPNNIAATTQQTNVRIPHTGIVVIEQSERAIPQFVVGPSELKMSESTQLYTSLIQQTGTSVASNIPIADGYIAIPHTTVTHIGDLSKVHTDVKNSDETSQVGVSHVVSISSSNGGTFNKQPSEPAAQLFLPPTSSALTSSQDPRSQALYEENKTSVCQFPVSERTEVKQECLELSGELQGEQSSESFSTEDQLHCKKFETLNSLCADQINETVQNNKPTGVVDPVKTERTIVEHDEMGNIAIINVATVEGSESYSRDEAPDWFYNHEPTIMPSEKAVSSGLWDSENSGKNNTSGIVQTDGMRPCSTLSPGAKEQSDSIDENEQSEFFTSRYIVDTQTMRKEAEALADAILAAISS